MISRCSIAFRFSKVFLQAFAVLIYLSSVASGTQSAIQGSNERAVAAAVKLENFKRVEFIDRRFGWAADDHNLWRTADGGKSWQRIRSACRRQVQDWPSGYQDVDNNIDRIQLLNRDTGWVLESSSLFGTTNGGRTWKKFERDRLDIRSFRFVSESNGFFVATRLHYGSVIDYWREAEIYRTTDSGVTWRKVSLKRDLKWIWLLDIGTSSPTDIWAVGDVTLNSADGGKTWKEIEIKPLYGRASRVTFVDRRTGWIEANTSVVTKDGGKTWLAISNDQELDRLHKSAIRGAENNRLWQNKKSTTR